MQLSSVVFPEPERPNRIVMPGAAVKFASKAKASDSRLRMSTESVTGSQKAA